MSPRLILRADAGHQLGSGHVMRLVALAEAAVEAGGQARMLIGGEPAASVAALAARGLDAVAVLGEPHPDVIARAADELGASAIVLDGPHWDPGWAAALARPGRTVASLDDRGLSPLPTPVVVNPGFGAEALADRYAASPVRLLGRRFHLLRRELRRWARGGEPIADKVRRVVITMGGSDPVGATARVVAAVPGERLELVVVLGPGFRDHAGLAVARARARARGHRVELVEHPPAMAPVLAACDLAISAAGGTLAELAYLGRPVYAVAIVDDQVELAARQREAGLVAGGWALGSVTDGEMGEELGELLDDAARRRAIAAAAAATIDGEGASRIVAAL